MAEKQYAVVTRALPVREGGRILVHAYGPYSRNKAGRISDRMKKDAVSEGYANRIEISICTLLDPQ